MQGMLGTASQLTNASTVRVMGLAPWLRKVKATSVELPQPAKPHCSVSLTCTAVSIGDDCEF